jgi:putative transcriptional regulator
MRPVILSQVASLLESQGFQVSSFIHSNSCFDLAARKGERALLIKVLANIDALRRDSAMELKRVGQAFKATPLVVGVKTKAFNLQDEIVYDRYGLNVLNPHTLQSVLEDQLPSVRYFKGRHSVELNGSNLKQMRNNLDFTLNDLAEKIGVSKKSLHGYEKGLSASLETGLKLEKVLKGNIIKNINPLDEMPEEKGEKVDFFDPSFDRIKDLGMDLSFFRHAPFRAANQDELLIEKGTAQDVKKKALVLGQTKRVLDTHAMVLTKKFKFKSYGETPIIEEEELHSLSKPRDLMALVKEREKGC